MYCHYNFLYFIITQDFLYTVPASWVRNPLGVMHFNCLPGRSLPSYLCSFPSDRCVCIAWTATSRIQGYFVHPLLRYWLANSCSLRTKNSVKKWQRKSQNIDKYYSHLSTVSWMENSVAISYFLWWFCGNFRQNNKSFSRKTFQRNQNYRHFPKYGVMQILW